jgi:hypothetical protein
VRTPDRANIPEGVCLRPPQEHSHWRKTGNLNAQSFSSAWVDRIAHVHLRMPSIDRGVSSFLWSLVFFLVLFFGGLAVGVSSGPMLVLSLVAAFLIFLFVRTRGAAPGRG